MAFLFRSGGPQIGAAVTPVRVTGVSAWAGPGAALAADISIDPDQARQALRPTAIGTSTGRGWAQPKDGGLRI
jgi:hypothetical protein